MTNIGFGKLKEKQLNYLWWHLLNDLLLIVIYFMVWRHCLPETVLHWPCMRQKLGDQERERGLKGLEVSPIIAGGLSDVIFDLEDVFCVKNVQLKEKTILSSLIMIHNQRSFDLSPSLGLPPLFRLILLYMYRNTDHWLLLVRRKLPLTHWL